MLNRIAPLAVVVAGICAFGAPVAYAFNAGGVKGNGTSTSAAFSADGRILAFMSAASNLTPDDTDARDNVFARDTQTGETVLVSRASGPKGANTNLTSESASVSADGRFVAFMSAATNIHPADPDSVADIYVRDLQTDTTILVSRASGARGEEESRVRQPVIAADGRRHLPSHRPTSIPPTATPCSTCTCATSRPRRPRSSAAPRGRRRQGRRDSINPSISDDGGFVAWDSARRTWIRRIDNSRDVYMRDLQTGATDSEPGVGRG